ncbi:hypothetical protein ABKT14_07970 [Enterobacter roggenkampii]|uniref:hypothetical protein n=1 Tax=Enterobacter roggenkampii TaxID=1812935 RepID=UPI0032B0217B
MSTITKQWLQQTIAEMEEHRDLFPGDLDDNHENVLAALRIALASLEAEAVAFVMADDLKDSSIISTPAYRDLGEAMDRTVGDVVALYAAPPAPVSVPEWTNEQCLEFLSIAFRHAEIKGDLELDDIRLGVKMVNGSRAAMLQGADGNSPVIGIDMASEPDRSVEVRYFAPPGYVMVPIEPTPEMLRAGFLAGEDYPGGVYRDMIAAAPQEEVKNG